MTGLRPRFVCPGCGERVQHVPPARWLVPAPQPEWSHLDGEPLCPVVGSHGYEPARPEPDGGEER